MSSTSAEEEFRVVIFYDRIASVGPAMAAYSHLMRELEGTFATQLRLWRTDVASSPECNAEANGDIESARMVIMAFQRAHGGPNESREWSNGEGAGHYRCPVAAALGTAITSYPSRGIWNHILRGATAQIQMDIFLWVPHFVEPPAAAPPPAHPAGAGFRPLSLETRQEVGSGIRGALLYRVNRPEGGGAYWETVMTLGAKSVCRRFASELHARAWLAAADHPVPDPATFDLEELNGRFRSPSFVR
jgi:hypothetical protein